MSSRPLYVAPYLHLRALPAFVELTPTQLKEVAYEAQEVVIPRGSVILEEGKPCGAMYLLVDGEVTGPSQGDAGPGRAIGFLETLSTGPVHSSVTTASDVLALRLETDAFRDICEQNFVVLEATLRYVARLVAEDHEALLRSISGAGARPIEHALPLDRVQRMVAFHRTPALPSRHMDALAELSGQVQEVRVPAGQTLWSPADAATHFHLVVSGRVALQGAGPDASVELGPGALPGLVETLAGGEYVYTAEAVRPTTLLRVEADPFMDILEDHFEMAFGLLSALARHRIDSRLRDREADSG